MAAPSDHSLPPRTRHLAWAGLWLPVPEQWRPVTLEGDADKGLLRLGDDQRTRLELVWARMSAKRFRPDRFVQRRLQRLPGDKKKRKLPAGTPVAHPALQPLILQTIPDLRAVGATPIAAPAEAPPGIDRLIGFAPATRRVIECIYHHGKPAEDLAFRSTLVPRLVDQPRDQPQRWAFFDTSFIAPAGMTYINSVLNLGDMRVRVAARGGELFGATVVVRQVYPATLALKRQALDHWLREFVREFRQTHRPPGAGAFGKADFPVESVQTKLGPTVVARTALRRLMRWTYWRAPRVAATWVIHDQAADRIIMLFVAEAPDRHQPVLDSLIDGLHWARHSS